MNYEIIVYTGGSSDNIFQFSVSTSNLIEKSEPIKFKMPENLNFMNSEQAISLNMRWRNYILSILWDFIRTYEQNIH